MALWQAQLREEVAVPEIEAELAGKRSYFPLNQTIELTCAEATSHYNLLNCLPRRGFAQGRRAQAVDSVVLPLLRYSCCLSAGNLLNSTGHSGYTFQTSSSRHLSRTAH